MLSIPIDSQSELTSISGQPRRFRCLAVNPQHKNSLRVLEITQRNTRVAALIAGKVNEKAFVATLATSAACTGDDCPSTT